MQLVHEILAVFQWNDRTPGKLGNMVLFFVSIHDPSQTDELAKGRCFLFRSLRRHP